MKILLFATIFLLLSSSFSGDGSPAAASIEGGWELVWGQYGENVRNPGKPFQFKLFTGKHFCAIMQGNDGKWNQAGGGAYVLDGNIYRETFHYCFAPEVVGGTIEWKYELKGDTLLMEGPVKVTDAAGKDISSSMDGLNHMREIRVRAK